jgi:hypothetical protein
MPFQLQLTQDLSMGRTGDNLVFAVTASQGACRELLEMHKKRLRRQLWWQAANCNAS